MVPCQDGQEVFPGQLVVQWFCHPQYAWWEQSESELSLIFSLVFFLCIFFVHVHWKIFWFVLPNSVPSIFIS